MKIQFKETPEQLELIAAMGSKDRAKASAAQFAFAKLIQPTLGHIYQQADTTGFLYRDMPYRVDDDPSFPIELFADVPEGHFSIWSAPKPGGLPSNHISQSIDEVKFTTYRLDSAWSINSKYARKMRLPIIAKALQRLVQEVLLKTNYSAWSVVLAALAQATHTIGGTSLGHVFASATAAQFSMDDFNQLQTYFRRLNSSWVGGTPVGGAGKPTDMIVSPEMLEKFRAMSYNPINTKANSAGTALGASSAAVTLPEAQRAALYNSAGVPEFYGINLIELLEFGKGQDYQTLFSEFIGSTDLPRLATKAASGETFSATADELVVIVDASKDMAYRAIATDSDTGSVFSLEADDQYQKRAEKLGWYGGIEEGRVVTDTRFIAAMVV
jgi:hypothetical protein